jgi:hypothetical protein
VGQIASWEGCAYTCSGHRATRQDNEIDQRRAQIVQLGVALHQLQENMQVWLPPPEESEEDPEEIQGMTDVDDE